MFQRQAQIRLSVCVGVTLSLSAYAAVQGAAQPSRTPSEPVSPRPEAVSAKGTVKRNAETPQARTDQTPPRIDRFTPPPGTWAVSNAGLPTVQIGFDESVAVPPGSVTAWTLGGGTLNGIATAYDDTTTTLTVTFSPPVRDDILTLVLDYTIADASGNALDGEVVVPASASLPSGNGSPGGQAVFRMNVLQGDANRDGVVNAADAALIRASLGKCTSDAGFNADADLNADGCVDVLDVGTFALAAGRSLPTTDGVPPSVLSALPDPALTLLSDLGSVEVSFSEPVDPDHTEPHTLFLLDGTGVIHLPASVTVSLDHLSATYTFSPSAPRCGAYALQVSNALVDSSGALLVHPTPAAVISGLLPPPAPVLDPHSTITSASSITITGVALGGATVEVAAPSGTFTYPVVDDLFSANVPLLSNFNNPLYFTSISTCGVPLRSTSVLTIVIPPIMKDAVSREFSVYNDTSQDQVNDAISREFSVLNQP